MPKICKDLLPALLSGEHSKTETFESGCILELDSRASLIGCQPFTP